IFVVSACRNLFDFGRSRFPFTVSHFGKRKTNPFQQETEETQPGALVSLEVKTKGQRWERGGGSNQHHKAALNRSNKFGLTTLSKITQTHRTRHACLPPRPW
ncbi:unnamed protein product, partial [Ectocarpus sp. 13 AM-2016]